MKTATKIQSGVYKITDRGETFIIRKVYGELKNSFNWIANGCNNLSECSDNNSCCVSFKTKKELINWILNF